MVELTKTTTLGIGVFILLALVGTVYNVDLNPDSILQPYTCGEILGNCFKLSVINDDGFQTRCYYNPTLPRTYKNCKTGWEKYEGKSTVIANEIKLRDYKELEISSEFVSMNELKDYVEDYKLDITSDVAIVKKVQKPNNLEVEVFWDIILYKPGVNDTKVEVYSRQLTTMVSAGLEDDDIEDIVLDYAEQWLERWTPEVELVYE